MKVISVRFKESGRSYYFDPAALEPAVGDFVIVETARGVECGEVVRAAHELPNTGFAREIKPVLRMADGMDVRRMRQNRADERSAFTVCEQRIAAHGLQMKLIDAEYTLDRNKLVFYFTADSRVDFRELVKDLAAHFHTRIELRQIGVRDESKMLGGLGICGKPFCCSTFLEDFHPVSIKMAKVQNLSLNPTKISGTCGRLMCCLKYEQEAYEDAVKRLPKEESFVECPDGVGTVSQVNLLRETMKIRLEDSSEPPRVYHNCEVRIVRNGKGKRPEGYVAPPREELEQLRKVTPPVDPTEAERRLSGSLSDALGRLGMETPGQESEGKGRRHGSRRRGDKPKAPQASAEKKQENKAPQERKKKDRPAEKKREGQPPQEKKRETQPAAPEAKTEGQGEKKRSRRRYHRRPKGDKPKEGGSAT